MATAEVLTFLRQQGPKLQAASDEDLIAFASQHPKMSAALDARDKAKLHIAATQKEAGLAGTMTGKQTAEAIQAKGVAEQAASNKQAYGVFAANAAKAVGISAATLASGGVALWPALGIMAGAGAGSSLAGTLIEEATGTHRAMAERAKDIAIDAGLGMAGEGIGRGIGLVAKRLLPQALTMAAARSDAGQKFLLKTEIDQLDGLYKTIQQTAMKSNGTKSFWTDVRKPIDDIARSFSKQPVGRGAFFGSKGFGAMSDKAVEGLEAAKGHLMLAKTGGQIGDLQPLDAVIKAQREFKKFAAGGGLSRAEEKIFQSAAEKLDKVINQHLSVVGPDAVAAYKNINQIGEAAARATAATKVTDILLTRFIIGSAAGAAGAVLGGKKGAVAGAAMGAVSPKLATLILEQIAAHPKAAAKMRRATELFLQGGPMKVAAFRLGQEAFNLVNAGQTIDQAQSLMAGVE